MKILQERRAAARFPLWTLALLGLFVMAGGRQARAKEDAHLNNEVVVSVEVERNGQRWPLPAIPSLEKGDLVYLRLTNARGFRDKFPFVANQRVASMKKDHGLMVIGAFVNRTAAAGLEESAFPRATRSTDGNALVFKVPVNEATPFFFLQPALYDTDYDRVKEWEQFVKTATRSQELRAYLLRQVTAPTAGGGPGRLLTPEETDTLLQRTQFLIPRIAAAQKVREAPDFKTRAKKDQAEQLYGALGLDLPESPGALDYANNLLDAFATTDPNKPVKVPGEQQLGNLITVGVTMLPTWYGSYLAGLNVVSKLAVILKGFNQRIRDERYFVAAQFVPKKDERGAELTGLYNLEPTESLLPNNPDKPKQTRKNVLVVCFGRTGLTRAAVRPTPGAPAATVFLNNEAPRRLLHLDAKSPLTPEQLERYTSGLQLHLLDGGAPVPLVYEKSANAFRLETAQPLPLKPTQAVLRAHWGHDGEAVDVSEKFRVAGVTRGTWVVENPTQLTPGGAEPLRLRSEVPTPPVRVVFRYKSGGEFEAQAVEAKQGHYAARFDLNGRRAGAGRLEIYKPGMDAPDVLETFKDETGAEVPIQVFDPLRPVGPDDARYYAHDPTLRLRRTLWTENTQPARVTVGGAIFERTGEEGEWIVFATKQPVTRAGDAPAALLLADKRTVGATLRVRPRRPAATLADWRQRERALLPWTLPENIVSQHAALLLTLRAGDGYRFTRNTRLVLGGASLSPDTEITDSAGAETATFTLDPRVFPTLRGRLTTRLQEDRGGGETALGDEFTLPFTLAQLPDGPLNFRFQNGKYRLIGQRLDVFAGAGSGDVLDAVQPVVTPQGAYIEFTGGPGQPLAFRLRQPDARLAWIGPIVPAAPEAPAVERTADGKRILRGKPAPGATVYLVYRSTDPSVPAVPSNLAGEIGASGGPWQWEDAAPLKPGDVVRYRVVAQNRQEGYAAEDFTSVGPVSAPVTAPAPAASPAP